MQPIAFHAVNAITIIISHFDYIDQTVNVRELLHNSCLQKRAYLVAACTICFLLSVSVLTCVLEDTIYSCLQCLIIVLHCTKDPLSFVRYLSLFISFEMYSLSLCCVTALACVCRVYIRGYLLT